MQVTTLGKLLQEARQLSPAEQLRLISALCDELRVSFPVQVIALEGRWADLPFNEAGMEEDLKALHCQSWQHLEKETRE